MSKTFESFLNNASKQELTDIINHYNEIAAIFDNMVLVPVGLKKEEIINYLVNYKKSYVKDILRTLNNKEFNEVVKGKYNIKLQRYLEESFLLNEDKVMYSDIKDLVNELVKDKSIVDITKKMSGVDSIVKGIVIAYGVIDTNYFKKILDDFCDAEMLIGILKVKEHENYLIGSKMILSKLLTNKKRIERYYKNDKYKKFSIIEFKELGLSKHHHSMKEYKKLMGTLNNNYVFNRKDIEFIDENIIIPYLYTSINEEDVAKDILVKKLEEFFEFREDKIRNKIYELVLGIRNNFPLWEYRGYSKNEVVK